MNIKIRYLVQFIFGNFLVFVLGSAIYYLIAINPVDGIVGSIFVGFLILWFLYVLLSIPGELRGLVKVLAARDPEVVINELSELRGRNRL